MKAKDIMNPHVITIGPDRTIGEAAQQMANLRISALPVVDDSGALIGIVSEGDLLRRAEIGTERHQSWWLEFVAGPAKLAGDYIKSHAGTVRDVMTKSVLTVTEETSVADIAEMLESKRIKRVPVVKGKAVIGVVSRANLIQALAAQKKTPVPASADDGTIRTEILARYRKERWAASPNTNVVVKDGVVELWGFTSSEEEIAAYRVLAEGVPGVKKVVDHRTVLTVPLGV